MTQFTSKGVKQINNRISLNMTFTFTICISLHFSSAREFQMGNFQKYWSQNVGQDFIVLDFFHGRNILKVDGRDGRDPQNLEKNASRRFTCMCEATECRAHVLICVATEYIVHVLICEATECRECVLICEATECRVHILICEAIEGMECVSVCEATECREHVLIF